jgi:hypothetical protein
VIPEDYVPEAPEPASLGEEIANVYEYNTDESNEWDSNDIVEEVARILTRDGFLTNCDEHGSYPTHLKQCPRCWADENMNPYQPKERGQ